uniref:Uncharacterized protein n=1 Tax=viral metagenome TaxID=1070528 RepID=A0A6M3LRP8_9ZZZZ
MKKLMKQYYACSDKASLPHYENIKHFRYPLIILRQHNTRREVTITLMVPQAISSLEGDYV